MGGRWIGLQAIVFLNLQCESGIHCSIISTPLRVNEECFMLHPHVRMREMKGDKNTAIGEVTVTRSTTMLKLPLIVAIIVTVVFTIILAPAWLDAVLDRGRSTLANQVGFPLFLCYSLFGTLIFLRIIKNMSQPYTFDSRGIRSLGITYPWQSVSCLYANPHMGDMVLLFRGLTGPAKSAGIMISKDRVKPSVDALIERVEAQGIPVKREEELSPDDFRLLWLGWIHGAPDRTSSEIVEGQRQQTFGYMITHWPEAGILFLVSAAVAVLILYAVVAIAYLALARSGRADAEFTTYFLGWSIATVALGIPALAAFRYWRTLSGIPAPRKPPG